MGGWAVKAAAAPLPSPPLRHRDPFVAALHPRHLGVVPGVDRGHEDLLRAVADGGLDGVRVQPPHRMVQVQAPEDVDPGHEPPHEGHPVGGALVVAFHEDGAHSRVPGLPGDVDVVEQAREYVRGRVNVDIARPLQEFQVWPHVVFLLFRLIEFFHYAHIPRGYPPRLWFDRDFSGF